MSNIPTRNHMYIRRHPSKHKTKNRTVGCPGQPDRCLELKKGVAHGDGNMHRFLVFPRFTTVCQEWNFASWLINVYMVLVYSVPNNINPMGTRQQNIVFRPPPNWAWSGTRKSWRGDTNVIGQNQQWVFVPENRPFSPKWKRESIPTIHFQMRAVSFMEGIPFGRPFSGFMLNFGRVSLWLEGCSGVDGVWSYKVAWLMASL